MKDEKHQKKNKKHDVALFHEFLVLTARRDEWMNDSSSAVQVSQRVPYNGSQKRTQRGILV